MCIIMMCIMGLQPLIAIKKYNNKHFKRLSDECYLLKNENKNEKQNQYKEIKSKT